MKKLRKKLLDSQGFRLALSYVIAAYIRLVHATARTHVLCPPEALPYLKGEKQALIAFWHGRMLLMPCLKPEGRTMDVLISKHRDGRTISETMTRFGIGTVTGSSTRGSLGALKQIFRTLREGGNVAITPDGPKGPFQVAAPGIAHTARRSDVPVLPITFSASRYKQARSWDRFFVALPFSEVYFVAGMPVAAAKDENVETVRLRIEASLRAITEEADRLAGVA